jgi:hypothetical protein
MIAWKEDTRYIGVVRTVTHRKVSRNLCGYWQGAADRIDDQVWTQAYPGQSLSISCSTRHKSPLRR